MMGFPSPQPLSRWERARGEGDDAQNWINADPGIGWANYNRVRRLDRFARPRGWFRGIDSVKPKAFHARLTATVDEIFLKWQVALVRFDNCPHGLIAHRQNSMKNSPCLAEITRDLREGLSLFQPPRPFDMCGNVLIAETEPIRPAQFFDVGNRLPRFVHASPARIWICKSRQCVADRVEIGTNVQAEMLKVVACVDDDG